MHLERCIPDVWYWWWLLIVLNFAGIFYFLAIGYKVKEGEHIHDKEEVCYSRRGWNFRMV